VSDRPDPRPLALLGAFLLGLGLAVRLLLPDEPSSSPIEGALARIPLFAGAAVVLLERALRGGGAIPWCWWLLPLAVLPGCFPATAASVTRGLDFLAACTAGLALRDLVTRDDMGPTLRRWLVALGAALCVIGLAQALWQRAELRQWVQENGAGMWADGKAQAFLESNRATSTLVNANAFAGLLLLLMPILASGRRMRNGVVGALFAGAFLAAGSAGAALSLLLACGLRLKDGAPWRMAFGAGIAGVLLLVASLATDWQLPIVGDKVGTFAQRIDYHALGLRALPEAGATGAGFETTRELRWIHARPDESHSAYLHDTYLQLFIETGVLGFALAALAVVLASRRRRDPTPSAPSHEPAKAGKNNLAIANLFAIGIGLGASIPVLLNGLPRVIPLTWEAPPVLDAILMIALIVGIGRALRGIGDVTNPMWSVGLVAFLLHALIDYDLYAPAAATTFAAFCALAPGRRSAVRGDRIATGLGAAALLAMPLLCGTIALKRDAAHVELLTARQRPTSVATPTASLALLDSLPDPDVLDRLSRQFSGKRGKLVDAALTAMPPAIREWPVVRRIEAQHLARWALVSAPIRGDALVRIRQLDVPEDPVRAEILAARIKIERLLGHDTLIPDLARSALSSLDLWRIDDEELRRSLESDAQ